MWWYIVAGALAILGTSLIVLNWDDIIISLKGKKIAVLGERAVGKTCLIKFFTEGSVPESYSQTMIPENTSCKRFCLEDLELTLKSTQDVPGGKDSYPVWKKLFSSSDITFYLLRMDKVCKEDEKTINRINDDLEHLGRWIDEVGEIDQIIVLVGTHCDLIPGYEDLNENNAGDFFDSLRSNYIIKKGVRVLGGGNRVKVAFGSLKNNFNSEVLTFQILKMLSV